MTLAPTVSPGLQPNIFWYSTEVVNTVSLFFPIATGTIFTLTIGVWFFRKVLNDLQLRCTATIVAVLHYLELLVIWLFVNLDRYYPLGEIQLPMIFIDLILVLVNLVLFTPPYNKMVESESGVIFGYVFTLVEGIPTALFLDFACPLIFPLIPEIETERTDPNQLAFDMLTWSTIKRVICFSIPQLVVLVAEC